MLLTKPTYVSCNPPLTGDLPGMCIHLISCFLKCCCIDSFSKIVLIADFHAMNQFQYSIPLLLERMFPRKNGRTRVETVRLLDVTQVPDVLHV